MRRTLLILPGLFTALYAVAVVLNAAYGFEAQLFVVLVGMPWSLWTREVAELVPGRGLPATLVWWGLTYVLGALTWFAVGLVPAWIVRSVRERRARLAIAALAVVAGLPATVFRLLAPHGMFRGNDGKLGAARPADHGQVMSMTVAPDGSLWAAGPGSLLHLEAGGWRERRLPGFEKLPADALAVAPDGTVWLVLSATIVKVTGDRWSTYAGPPGEPDVAAHDVAVDRGGNLWFAGQRGVVLVPPAPGKPRFFANDLRRAAQRRAAGGGPVPAAPSGEVAGPCGSSAMNVWIDAGDRVWVPGGGSILSGGGPCLSVFAEGRWRTLETVLENAAVGAEPGDITSLAELADGSLVVGTLFGRVLVSDGERLRLAPSPLEGRGTYVSALVRGRSGQLWLAAGDGRLFVRSPTTESWRETHLRSGLRPTHIHALAEDPRGTVWAATDGGVEAAAEPG